MPFRFQCHILKRSVTLSWTRIYFNITRQQEFQLEISTKKLTKQIFSKNRQITKGMFNTRATEDGKFKIEKRIRNKIYENIKINIKIKNVNGKNRKLTCFPDIRTSLSKNDKKIVFL